MSLRRLVVVCALSCVVALPARAAETQAEKEKFARELATIVVSEKTWSDMLDQTLAAIANATKGQQLPPDFEPKARQALREVMPYDYLLGLQIEMQAKYYSVAEMKDLIAFYKTPTGQKAIRIMPALTAEVAGRTQTKLQTELPVVMQRLFAPKGEAAPPTK